MYSFYYMLLLFFILRVKLCPAGSLSMQATSLFSAKSNYTTKLPSSSNEPRTTNNLPIFLVKTLRSSTQLPVYSVRDQPFAPSPENNRITEIPEYSEYLKRLSSTTEVYVIDFLQKNVRAHETPANFFQFPTIPLCKELPKEASLYNHLFCWSMIALFALAVISLIIYQLRSILWLKLNLSERNQRIISVKRAQQQYEPTSKIEVGNQSNEQRTNHNNLEEIGIDMPDIPGKLSMRPTT